MGWREELLESIEFNKSRLGTADAVNDLIVTDLLSGLGYNYKRSLNVSRLRDGEQSNVYWAVKYSEDQYFTVAVLPFGSISADGFTVSDSSNYVEYSRNNVRYDGTVLSFIFLTDGHTCRLYSADDCELLIDFDLSQSDGENARYGGTVRDCLNALTIGGPLNGYASRLKYDHLKECIEKSVENMDLTLFDKSSLVAGFRLREEKFSWFYEQFYEALHKKFGASEDLSKLEELCDELKQESSGKGAKIAELEEELSHVMESMSNVQVDNRTKRDSLKAYEDKIMTLVGENNALKADNKKLRDQVSRYLDGDMSDNSLISQIERLSIDKADLQDQVEARDKEIEELKFRLNNGIDTQEHKSLKLLESAKMPAGWKKAYIGVVNMQLYMREDIKKFIGDTLQEVYKHTTFKLMDYVYNGDIFGIQQTSGECDVILGGKSYNIDLMGCSDDVCLQKLKTLCDVFKPSVIFNCKVERANGVAEEVEPETSENTDEVVANGEEFVAEEEDTVAENPGNQLVKNCVDSMSENNEIFESSESMDNLAEPSENDSLSDSAVETPEQADDTENEYSDKYLIFNTDKICDALWSEDVSISEIKYISVNNTVYLVDNTDTRSKVQSTVFALVAASNNPEESITKLRKSDLSTVSGFVGAAESEESIRIPYTSQYANVDSLEQFMPIFVEICDILDVPSSSCIVFCCGSIQEDSSFDSPEYYTGRRFYDNEAKVAKLYACDDSDELRPCIVSSGFIRSVIMNKSQIELQSTLIKKIQAVKTASNQYDFSSADDICRYFYETLSASDDVDVVLNKVGRVPGTNIYPVSTDETDAIASAEVNGTVYYLHNMEQWQLMYVVLKLYIIATGTPSVTTRVLIDSKLYNMYTSEFKTADASDAAAVNTLVGYLRTRLK